VLISPLQSNKGGGGEKKVRHQKHCQLEHERFQCSIQLVVQRVDGRFVNHNRFKTMMRKKKKKKKKKKSPSLQFSFELVASGVAITRQTDHFSNLPKKQQNAK
jgi:hypothetical protein